MTLWHWITNNPPYAEEKIINQEIEQIQETLGQFKQLVPENFTELERLNWMCSTQGWKEPVCERYNCLIKGEWKQVDIRHELLEKLKLTKDIAYPIHISQTVLDEGLDHYFAYNVKDEKEIFLRKTFTVDNLEEDITSYYNEIKELERENKELKDELEKEKGWWDKWINDRIENFVYVTWGKVCLLPPDLKIVDYRQALDLGASFDKNKSIAETESKKSKKWVKEKIYQYYLNK